MPALIRLATEDDAAAMLDIYAPVVQDSVISFELTPPTVEEFQARIASNLTFAPWLVCEIDGKVVGYVYGARFRQRVAYQWTVEVTVYVHHDYTRRGIGRGLYVSLFECLRLQGFVNAIAVIALPNPGSVALHEQVGFEKAGVFHLVGYKHGQWLDVGWWELTLLTRETSPTAPLPFDDAIRLPDWDAALKTGEPLIRA
ncbi:MAG: GNAT family N-acetyltransferase [Candidatus Poribacteria bacterium]|nr:GNAT family N-acetyltransferase [Candidatus Poribacteria bacterium]